MKTSHLTALLALTALILTPTLAVAHKGQGKQGKSSAQAAKQAAKKTTRCERPKRVAFLAAGTFNSASAGQLSVKITRANRHARVYLRTQDASFAKGSVVAFPLASAKLTLKGVSDTNADGKLDLSDAQASDRVRVLGKVLKSKRGCTAAPSTLKVRKLTVIRRQAARQG